MSGTQSATSSEDDSALRSRIESAPWLVMNASVSRLWFLGEPVAVQRRLVKAIGEYARIPLEFKHVEKILRFAAEDGASGKQLSLPLRWKAVREPEELVFLTPDLREKERPADYEPADYEYDLPFSGHLIVTEAGLALEVRRIPAANVAGYDPDHLLDTESLPGRLRVRNWRPGDRFWPAHTKSPKKIKELLQERHVAQPERRLWPVMVSGNEVVWMRGFPSPSKFRVKPGREAILIVEKSSTEKTAT
jgi:tRNA(Ile)-lysidine synthase